MNRRVCSSMLPYFISIDNDGGPRSGRAGQCGHPPLRRKYTRSVQSQKHSVQPMHSRRPLVLHFLGHRTHRPRSQKAAPRRDARRSGTRSRLLGVADQHPGDVRLRLFDARHDLLPPEAPQQPCSSSSPQQPSGDALPVKIAKLTAPAGLAHVGIRLPPAPFRSCRPQQPSGDAIVW